MKHFVCVRNAGYLVRGAVNPCSQIARHAEKFQTQSVGLVPTNRRVVRWLSARLRAPISTQIRQSIAAGSIRSGAIRFASERKKQKNWGTNQSLYHAWEITDSTCASLI